MSKLKTIVVNVYNVTHTNPKNYITAIEIPMYKQTTRTARYLKNYVKMQRANDFNHRRMRFYEFLSNSFVFNETDLESWD
jgi:hypothetical protein